MALWPDSTDGHIRIHSYRNVWRCAPFVLSLSGSIAIGALCYFSSYTSCCFLEWSTPGSGVDSGFVPTNPMLVTSKDIPFLYLLTLIFRWRKWNTRAGLCVFHWGARVNPSQSIPPSPDGKVPSQAFHGIEAVTAPEVRFCRQLQGEDFQKFIDSFLYFFRLLDYGVIRLRNHLRHCGKPFLHILKALFYGNLDFV